MDEVLLADFQREVRAIAMEFFIGGRNEGGNAAMARLFDRYPREIVATVTDRIETDQIARRNGLT
jgi:hypothetical protein